MHPNEELLREGYEAFARGDMAAVIEDWAPDIIWHARGSIPIARDLEGPDQVVQFLGQIVGLTEGTFRIEIERIFADDDRAVVLCRQSGTAAGHPLDSLCTHVYRIRDGKICEGWFLIDRALEADAALKEAYDRSMAKTA